MPRELCCEQCGKIFVTPKGRHKTCSKTCSVARKKYLACARTKKWIENNAERHKAYQLSKLQPVKQAECKNCGSFFVKRAAGLFCGRSCRAKYRRKTKPEWYKAAHIRHKAKQNARNLQRYYDARNNAPWRILIEAAAVRARKKKIPFNLTPEWGAKRWTGICEVTGIPFNQGVGIRGFFSPSLDQIVAGAGYTQNNCRFVIWAYNAAKGNGTDEDMNRLATAIVTSRALDAATALSLPT